MAIITNTMPSTVRAALADPKGATTFVLEVAESYIDFADPEQFELLQEEYSRRTDPEYTTPGFEF